MYPTPETNVPKFGVLTNYKIDKEAAEYRNPLTQQMKKREWSSRTSQKKGKSAQE